MKKAYLLVLVAIVAIALGLASTVRNRLEGRYRYVARDRTAATLVITRSKYTVCYKECRSGPYRIFDGMIQFQGAAMLTFGQKIGAALDPDIDGRITAVRLNIYHSLTGVTIVQEDNGTGQFDYFTKDLPEFK